MEIPVWFLIILLIFNAILILRVIVLEIKIDKSGLLMMLILQGIEDGEVEEVIFRRKDKKRKE